MMQLLRYHAAPPSHHVCAGPFGRTAPIGHVETDKNTRQSHRPTCQGPEESHERVAKSTPRRTWTHPFRSSLNRKIFRYSPQDRLGCLDSSPFPSEIALVHLPNVG